MTSTYTTGSAQDQPVAQAGILETIGIGYSKPLAIKHVVLIAKKEATGIGERIIETKT